MCSIFYGKHFKKVESQKSRMRMLIFIQTHQLDLFILAKIKCCQQFYFSLSKVASIKKKKLAYYGHVRRHYSLQKLVLEGKVGGKSGRGRRRKSWTGNVSEMTKMSMAQCSVKALDRREWRTMVSNLYAETEPR